MVLDSSLTFDQHVSDTVRNCNFHLRALRHIRPSLTSDVANTIACSFTGFRLDYFNSLLVGISEQNWDSIQRLQSKAARIVCNASRDSPSSDLLHSLHWLPVCHRIEFKTATLCFKAVKLGTPSYLNNMLQPYAPLQALCSSNRDLLTVPRTDTSLGLRRFSVAGPQVWNLEPVTTRTVSMQYNFVLQVKPQDTLLPPPHGQLAPCLVAPPIAFNDEVCAR